MEQVEDCISRQAAINMIHKVIYDFFDVADDESEEPISEKDMLLLEANKAICNEVKNLPSAQQEPKTADSGSKLHENAEKVSDRTTDGLISRQAAIDAVIDCMTDKKNGEPLTDMLKHLPSAQPERKKGKWEPHNTYHGDDTSGFVDTDWRCSECGKQATVDQWMLYELSNFCPNCGADMGGKDD